jgi:hypothetical protein
VTLIGIISVDNEGGWGWGLHNGRWHGFGGILLAHLLFFFIRVVENDDLAITRWPEEPAVEVTEESLGELCIP